MKLGWPVLISMISVIAVSALPVRASEAEDGCNALKQLDELIYAWNRQEVIHPSRIEELRKIASSLRGLCGKSSAEPVGSMNFTGIWDTNFGTMEIEQAGDRVEGTYEHNHGQIEGVVADGVLRGRWSEAPTYKEPQDSGQMELMLSEDGKDFIGKWRNGSEGAWYDGWNGKRE